MNAGIDGEAIDWQARALAAEKTVNVLKQKVRGLFSGEDSSQIHGQLSAARRRQERLVMARGLAEQKAAELTLLVAERTRDIQRILDNVTFGFLVVDGQGRVRPGFTKSCAQLLDAEVSEGVLLSDLLRVGDDKAEFVLMGVEQVFEDLMPESVGLEQIGTRFQVGHRVLRLEGGVVRSGRGDVDGILFTISDITALDASRRAAKEREALLQIVSQRAAFEEFVKDARALVLTARSSTDEVVLRRILHTIKGNAACWGLRHVAHLAHDLESQGSLDEADLDRLEDGIRAFLDKHETLLGVKYDDFQRTYGVTETSLTRLGDMLDSPAPVAAAWAWMAELMRRPARELLGPVDMYVERLAAKLGKQVRFELAGDDMLVDVPSMRPVLRNVTHLLRNALDHGIEMPEERGDKPAVASLRLAVTENARAWTVTVSDDGAGIDFKRLAERAVATGQMGRYRVEVLAAAGRLDELLYVDGLSSAEKVSKVSGRGVGMNAMASAVKAQKGKMRIETGDFGTRAIIIVPKPGLRRTAQASTMPHFITNPGEPATV